MMKTEIYITEQNGKCIGSNKMQTLSTDDSRTQVENELNRSVGKKWRRKQKNKNRHKKDKKRDRNWGQKMEEKERANGLFFQGEKHIKKKVVSDVACGLIPTLKQRQKMNTDRKRGTT